MQFREGQFDSSVSRP
nr:unnamed protein product [Callosobruchus chinensis]